jgi:ubiquinone/menaquinone biosynthesis C-methylase UbiE
MTDGLNSFEKLPDNYFDMIFSQAVLEHIRISEFHKTLCEMYRVLKTGCYTSHVIDFQDHLDNSLNSLRFSSKLWESNLFSKSGFYTNRLRKSEVLNEFIKVGFKIRSVSCSKWDKIPLDVKKLYGKYKNYSEDDLLTKGMTIVLQK